MIGLTVGLAAFFCGVFVTEVFRFTPRLISKPVVEEVKLVEFPEAVLETVEKIEEEGEFEQTFTDEDFIGGWYRLDRFKGMDEVNLVSLSSEWAGKNNEKMVRSAIVFTGKNFGDKLFHSVRAEIDHKKVKFRTEKIKGVEYRFEGTFFKGKTSGKDEEKVLRATLQKFIKGKKIAEVSGDFAYFEPRCWH